MATPDDVFEMLRNNDGPGVLRLSPGPVRIKVGDDDMRAAKLLKWWEQEFPDTKVSDLFDALDAAKWWVMFFAAQDAGAESGE